MAEVSSAVLPGQTQQPLPGVDPANIPLQANPNGINPKELTRDTALVSGINWAGQLNNDIGTQAQGDRAQAQAILAAGASTGEGDINARNTSRDALAKQMGDFQANQSAQGGQFQAQMDQGLNNSLSIARRQMGGTGMAGSQQGGSMMGNIVAANDAARSKGLLDLQDRGVQELNTMANTEGQTLQQSLSERGYNLNQANTLAQQLDQQANDATAGYQGMFNKPQSGPSFASQLLGSALNAGSQVAGAYAGRG